jgi:hypothetical protein
VIIADPGREHEAAMRLGRIGFDQIAGYLEDGLHSLESRPELTTSTERVSAQLAADRIAAAGSSEQAPLLVDVRAPGERQAGARLLTSGERSVGRPGLELLDCRKLRSRGSAALR